MTHPTKSDTHAAQDAAPTPAPANLQIESVRVDGFRALTDVCMVLDPGTTILVGENNTGKTSLLQALATAFGDRGCVPDDLQIGPGGAAAESFVIDVAVVPSTELRFDQPIATLLGTAVQRDGAGREYFAFRTRGSRSVDGSGVELRRRFLQGWSTCRDDAFEAVEMDQPSVSERVLRLFAFSLLDSTRDLVTRLRERTSVWGRLLADIKLPDRTREEIEVTLADVGRRLVDESPVLGNIRGELAEVQRALATIREIRLEPLPVRVEELARSVDVHISAPGGPPIPLRMQGHGSRSLAELMVFRAFATSLLAPGAPVVPHAITALEEPEAHLHPQAQVAVAQLIDSVPGQRLFSTHSPQLASEAALHSIRLLRRVEASVDVSQITNLSPEDALKVRRLVERPFGQVLFARLVIVGDGATERAGLPVFAQAHWSGTPGEGRGVSFIDPQSLANSGHLIKMVEDLGIPWLILADGDKPASDAFESIGELIGRRLDATSPGVFTLPSGHSFESYLISEGFAKEILAGVAAFYGREAMDEFRKQGKNERLGEDELILKFLRRRKGSYGGAIAEAIVSETDDEGRPRMPAIIRELLKAADELLAAG